MSFHHVKSYLGTAGAHLGDLIWWALADARIGRTELEQVWASAQLDPALLPEPPTVEKALKTAVRETHAGHTDRLLRLGLENESHIIYAVVREHRGDDGSVSFTQETRIVLDRTSEKLTSDDPHHDLAQLVAAKFAELRTTHTPDDLRRAMLRVLDACAAVTLRDHGGVYWVPAPHAETARRLQACVEKIGSSKVYLLPVHASPDANRTLGDSAKLAIEDELAALKAEVEGFLQQPPERVSTLVRRLDAFEALKVRAELYRSVLQVQVLDLEKTLGELTLSVETLLNRKDAA